MRESETISIDESTARDAPSVRPAPLVETSESASIQEVRRRPFAGLGLKTWIILAISLAVVAPTAGDYGVTWDEPQYRHSQLLSVQWWRQLGEVRSWRQAAELFDPITLLYFWDYGHYGMNFHPPLAGQLNLATHTIFGHWMKDIPARRMASVIEFAITIAIGFHFLSRRYGELVGLVMAGSLLLMPRLYGQAHLIDTDIPGLLLWAATALAFWKGLHESGARRWRVAVGILLGLAFVEKMGAVMVLFPLLLWLVIGHLPLTLARPGGRFDWIDGLLTTGAMLAPLGLAFQQIQILQQQLPPPAQTRLFVHRPVSDWSGAILAIPLAVWIVRRALGRFFPRNKVWGVERPALETWTAILAFAPVIGWLGNPSWWRETLPRLAHYYTLSVDREHSLPRIQIIYFGQIYEYSVPWHNAWVLMGITVPVVMLAAGVIGILWAIGQIRRDRLPFYFVIHFLTWPLIRMLPTPAHDGVRLFLPTFFFLAAFAGWGTVWVADVLARGVRVPAWLTRVALAGAVLGSSAFALYRIHPYELSYYNELIGGPRGAWERGFEFSYWYDAFTDAVLDDLNRKLPPDAQIDFLSETTKTAVGTFTLRQNLGALRGDIVLARLDTAFPFVWLLAQDSKADAFTRLLFAMRPWYASEPRQLDGARIVSVDDPVAVSRAWALFVLLDAPDRNPKERPAAPAWIREHVPWLGRLWSDGLTKARRLTLKQTVLAWSQSDPDGLLAAARVIASRQPIDPETPAERLMELLTNQTRASDKQIRHSLTDQLLNARPEALVEAVEMLNSHRDEIVTVMTRYGYTDPLAMGGYLDRDLPFVASSVTGK
jgi:hypothetical protein